MLQLKNITKDYKIGNERSTLKASALTSVKASSCLYSVSRDAANTLLNIIGGLDRYTDGDLIIGKSTKKFKKRRLGYIPIITRLDSYSRAII